MVNYPGCKINIGLNITGKRDDGFHNLESVFYPLNLSDILEIIPSKEFNFTCSGIPIPGTIEDNIIIKAYELFKNLYDIPPVKIHLHKTVPMGAGLGGGSANGAATILMLNDLFGLNLSTHLLEAKADELGSDCPFFIQQKPAFVSGKGEDIFPIKLNLKGYYIKLIKPKIHISTKTAFENIQFSSAGQLKNLEKLPISDWKAKVNNDFESSIFPKFPEIASLKKQLYKEGAVYASLTGTGSTVYGLFINEPQSTEKDNYEWISKI